MKNTDQWIRINPQGLNISNNDLNPFILFKNEGESLAFPVWVPAMQVSIIGNQMTTRHPHEVTLEILAKTGFKVEAVFFTEVVENQQWGKLVIKSLETSDVLTLALKAHEAISVAHLVDTEYYASAQFIEKARKDEIFEKDSPDFQKEQIIRKFGQKYLM